LDGNGQVNKREFIKILRQDKDIAAFFDLPQQIKQEDGSLEAFESFFQAVDTNDDRELTWDEFLKFLMKRPIVSQRSSDATSSASLPQGGGTPPSKAYTESAAVPAALALPAPRAANVAQPVIDPNDAAEQVKQTDSQVYVLGEVGGPIVSQTESDPLYATVKMKTDSQLYVADVERPSVEQFGNDARGIAANTSQSHLQVCVPVDVERQSAAPSEEEPRDALAEVVEPQVEMGEPSNGEALRGTSATEDTVGPTPAEAVDEPSTLTTNDDASLERIQDSVAEFSKKAATGAPTVYFNEKSGKRMNVTYKMSGDLAQLTFVGERRGFFSSPFSLTIPIANIQDVDDFDGCQELINPKARTKLTNRETETLLMVFYEAKNGKMDSFCLIEKSVESRDHFSIGLKTLASSLKE